MKLSPEYHQAQESMKPGAITALGFLGNDHRNISDIIEADEELMAQLGISFEILVSRLKELMTEGKKGLGEPVTVSNTWLVRVDETRGTLPSPFPEDGIWHKVNAEVNLLIHGENSGKILLYNDLCIHLIEKHHFFQGIGSPFRMNPIQAKEVLCL